MRIERVTLMPMRRVVKRRVAVGLMIVRGIVLRGMIVPRAVSFCGPARVPKNVKKTSRHE